MGLFTSAVQGHRVLVQSDISSQLRRSISAFNYSSLTAGEGLPISLGQNQGMAAHQGHKRMLPLNHLQVGCRMCLVLTYREFDCM